tara:strand:+ start:475 stop:681 length:207 start_codon:yes stop_codon:yes gene_type:complete
MPPPPRWHCGDLLYRREVEYRGDSNKEIVNAWAAKTSMTNLRSEIWYITEDLAYSHQMMGLTTTNTWG